MPEEQKEPLPDFETQTKLITDMLNDMAEKRLVSIQTVTDVAFDIVCDSLAKMPRNDFKQHYNWIKLVAKVMRAKDMSGGK